MIKALRRRASHLFARMCIAIEPDPPMTITTATRIDTDYETLADLVSGHIVGRGVAGRAFTPGSGVSYSY